MTSTSQPPILSSYSCSKHSSEHVRLASISVLCLFSVTSRLSYAAGAHALLRRLRLLRFAAADARHYRAPAHCLTAFHCLPFCRRCRRADCGCCISCIPPVLLFMAFPLYSSQFYFMALIHNITFCLSSDLSGLYYIWILTLPSLSFLSPLTTLLTFSHGFSSSPSLLEFLTASHPPIRTYPS